MKVLVVGGGGREHALVWRLLQDPGVSELLAAPGNAGIARDVRTEPIEADDVAGIVGLVERENVDLTVVGPEAPLVSGLADELVARGSRVFGPTRDGARLEGSKAWTKGLCEAYGIPTGGSRVVRSMEEGQGALEEFGPPFVVKADGLAAGKGVVIAEERSSAVRALEACLVDGAFREAGSSALVEEHLTGREVSAFALTDGHDVLPLVMAQEFKRVGDADTGPNTGGMGAYSPVPFVDEETASRIWDEVLVRTVRALEAEGVSYRGVLYAGLMITAEGPRLLEYNCRFGDPETQVIVPRVASSLVDLLSSCADGALGSHRASLSPEACVTVVAASGGYPGAYETGFEISGLEAAREVEGAVVFHSGTAERQGRVVTSGGRVLSVSAVGSTIADARALAYEVCSRIAYEGMHYRRDIAERAAEEASG